MMVINYFKIKDIPNTYDFNTKAFSVSPRAMFIRDIANNFTTEFGVFAYWRLLEDRLFYLSSDGFVREVVNRFISKNWERKAFSTNVSALTNDDENLLEFLGNLFAKIEDTRDYYEPLLEVYRNQKANLMNPIRSSVVGGFNEMPQTPFDSALTDVDVNYLTNQTKTESATEGGSVISRIREIQESYRSILDEWCEDLEGVLL